MRRWMSIVGGLLCLPLVTAVPALAAPSPPRTVPEITDVRLDTTATPARVRVDVGAAPTGITPAAERLKVTLRIADGRAERPGDRVTFRETRVRTVPVGDGRERVVFGLSRPTSRWLAAQPASRRGELVRVFVDHQVDVGPDTFVDHHLKAATTLADVSSDADGQLTIVNGLTQPVNTFGQSAQCVYDQGDEGSDPSGFTGLLPPGGSITQGLTPDLDIEDQAAYNGPGWAQVGPLLAQWNVAPSGWVRGLQSELGLLQYWLSPDQAVYYCGRSCGLEACGIDTTSQFQLMAAGVDGVSLSSTVAVIPNDGGFGLLTGAVAQSEILSLNSGLGLFYQCGYYGQSCAEGGPGLIDDLGLTFGFTSASSGVWTATITEEPLG